MLKSYMAEILTTRNAVNWDKIQEKLVKFDIEFELFCVYDRKMENRD